MDPCVGQAPREYSLSWVSQMNDVQKAVLRCRDLTRSYVHGEFDYSAYREQMARVMSPLDPLDWAIEQLSDSLADEAERYVFWLGGEFGESEDQIPRRAGWKYGESDETYGWVDQEAYRARLHEAFRDVFRLRHLDRKESGILNRGDSS